MIRTVLLVAAALAAMPAAPQVYKWVDSAGRVHFSDKAPPDAKAETLKIESYTAPPVVERAPEKSRGTLGAAQPAAGSPQLVMYATAWCGYCRRARAHLAKKNVPYREIDIEASSANREQFRAYGGRGVPFFVAGSRTMRGYSAEALDQFLAAGR